MILLLLRAGKLITMKIIGGDKMLARRKGDKGFTLIELLVVIVIIVALAVAVYVALDPSKRIKDARDARRTSDVDSILTAIHQYIVDNKGAIPSGLATTDTQLGIGNATECGNVSTGTCSVGAVACVDLSTALAKYLQSIPQDPKDGTPTATGYAVNVNANNIVTVKACGVEEMTSITSSR